MADSQLVQTTELISGMLFTVAVAVLMVAALSFFVARKYGGHSRSKRQAIFTVVSGIGFLGIMCFVFLRTTGRA